MDPESTLYNMLEAITENDRESAIEHLGELQGWLANEGFLPANANKKGDNIEVRP